MIGEEAERALGVIRDDALAEGILVSYDIARQRTRVRGKVHRKVYGEVSRKTVGGVAKNYRYEGLPSHRGAVRIGQSVLFLPPRIGNEFLDFLRRLHVTFTARTVYVSTEEFFPFPGPREEVDNSHQSTLK